MGLLEEVEKHRSDIQTDSYTVTWRELLNQYRDGDPRHHIGVLTGCDLIRFQMRRRFGAEILEIGEQKIGKSIGVGLRSRIEA
jgi:hypothetical protein